MSMRDSGVDSSLSLSGSTKYADGSAIGPKDRPRTADDFPYGRIRHCSGVPWDDHHMARHLDRSTAIHGCLALLDALAYPGSCNRFRESPAGHDRGA